MNNSNGKESRIIAVPERPLPASEACAIAHPAAGRVEVSKMHYKTILNVPLCYSIIDNAFLLGFLT